MSNRPNYARRARRRRAAAAAFDLVRAVHGCECPTVDVRHRADGITYRHDDGCPLVGRSQLIIVPGGHHPRTRRRQARPPKARP